MRILLIKEFFILIIIVILLSRRNILWSFIIIGAWVTRFLLNFVIDCIHMWFFVIIKVFWIVSWIVPLWFHLNIGICHKTFGLFITLSWRILLFEVFLWAFRSQHLAVMIQILFTISILLGHHLRFHNIFWLPFPTSLLNWGQIHQPWILTFLSLMTTFRTFLSWLIRIQNRTAVYIISPFMFCVFWWYASLWNGISNCDVSIWCRIKIFCVKHSSEITLANKVIRLYLHLFILQLPMPLFRLLYHHLIRVFWSLDVW